MKEILVVSVGGSADPILDAIGKMRPDFVCFLCSTGNGRSDRSVAEEIAPKAGPTQERFLVEGVESPDVLRSVLAACARINAELEHRFADEETHVTVNYTGGTRTMSAGLVALAQEKGWEAELTEHPAPRWCGPVSRLELCGVTAFSNLELTFEHGINVILGENGTGKTHFLKCIYALLRAAADAGSSGHEGMATALPDRLQRVLWGNRQVPAGKVRSWFATEDNPCTVQIECQSGTTFLRREDHDRPPYWRLPRGVHTGALFVPSREVLTMFPGFAAAYEGREQPFDETYYDLCEELDRTRLPGLEPASAPVVNVLEDLLGGCVRRDVDEFVIDTEHGTVRAPMAAEGHCKLATLDYLIANGALGSENVIFWDEPEANLNPKLVRALARLLRTLARAGAQIFLATHDYLLTRELSLEAEYHPDEAHTAFYSLHRSPEDGSVVAEQADRWDELDHNPILEAYSEHSDRELELFGGQ